MNERRVLRWVSRRDLVYLHFSKMVPKGFGLWFMLEKEKKLLFERHRMASSKRPVKTK
jgi:hypothetical protein